MSIAWLQVWIYMLDFTQHFIEKREQCNDIVSW